MERHPWIAPPTVEADIRFVEDALKKGVDRATACKDLGARGRGMRSRAYRDPSVNDRFMRAQATWLKTVFPDLVDLGARPAGAPKPALLDFAKHIVKHPGLKVVPDEFGERNAFGFEKDRQLTDVLLATAHNHCLKVLALMALGMGREDACELVASRPIALCRRLSVRDGHNYILLARMALEGYVPTFDYAWYIERLLKCNPDLARDVQKEFLSITSGAPTSATDALSEGNESGLSTGTKANATVDLTRQRSGNDGEGFHSVEEGNAAVEEQLRQIIQDNALPIRSEQQMIVDLALSDAWVDGDVLDAVLADLMSIQNNPLVASVHREE